MTTTNRSCCVHISAHQEITHSVIQNSIDTLAVSGVGDLILPPGRHVLADSLHLRSGVHIIGDADTVLTRHPSISSPIADYLGFGFYEFTVRHPHLFEVGMGVFITDDNASGFYTTIATIIARRGDTFFIDRPLNHDYHPHNNGRVLNLFPLISGIGVCDSSVSNLTLDGNFAETEVLNGCRGGGVFLLNSHKVRLKEVEVHSYQGDAVSFQQCTDIIVDSCTLHHNARSGLHPGSGSVRYVMKNNHIHDNGGCGIFYCLRTTHSLCANNLIESNGIVGISVGERDRDHLICGNTIRGNAREGIIFRAAIANGGDRVQIVDNAIGPNWSQGMEEKAAEINIESGLRDIHIAGNVIEPMSHAALNVASGSDHLSFSDNLIKGQPQSAGAVIGSKLSLSFSTPALLPKVGPKNLPSDGAFHLHVSELPIWTETLNSEEHHFSDTSGSARSE